MIENTTVEGGGRWSPVDPVPEQSSTRMSAHDPFGGQQQGIDECSECSQWNGTKKLKKKCRHSKIKSVFKGAAMCEPPSNYSFHILCVCVCVSFHLSIKFSHIKIHTYIKVHAHTQSHHCDKWEQNHEREKEKKIKTTRDTLLLQFEMFFVFFFFLERENR